MGGSTVSRDASRQLPAPKCAKATPKKRIHSPNDMTTLRNYIFSMLLYRPHQLTMKILRYPRAQACKPLFCNGIAWYACSTGFAAALAPWLIRVTLHLPRAAGKDVM